MALQTIPYKKIQQDVFDSAHKVLLAGLGAVSLVGEGGGEIFDRLLERGRHYEVEGKKQLDTLVRRGREMESKGRKQVTQVKKSAGNRVEELQGEMDARIGKLAQRLGIPHRNQIRSLAHRVEELTRQLEALQGKSVEPPAPAVFHLLPQDDGWKIQDAGDDRTLSTHTTKDEALAAAREIAQAKAPSRLVVHRVDGSVQTSYSYDEESVTG